MNSCCSVRDFIRDPAVPPTNPPPLPPPSPQDHYPSSRYSALTLGTGANPPPLSPPSIQDHYPSNRYSPLTLGSDANPSPLSPPTLGNHYPSSRYSALAYGSDTINASNFVTDHYGPPSVRQAWDWNTNVDWDDSAQPNDSPVIHIQVEEGPEINLGLLDTAGLIVMDDIPEAEAHNVEIPSPASPPIVEISSPASPPIPCPERLIESTVNAGANGDTECQASLSPPVSSSAAHPVQENSTVPGLLPKEVQTLIDAYIHCTPVLCIASNACMITSWGVKLPEEMGFAYLGFHSIVGVQVSYPPRLWARDKC